MFMLIGSNKLGNFPALYYMLDQKEFQKLWTKYPKVQTATLSPGFCVLDNGKAGNASLLKVCCYTES